MSICLSVCSFVYGRYRQAIGSLHGLFEEPIIGLLTFKMADVCHLENYYIAISQGKLIQF